MINKYTYKELVWIDLESPTSDEVKKVSEEFSIDPLVSQDLLTPATKPRIEMHPGFVYFVMHIPVLKHSHLKPRRITQEIDFIIGHNFIITTHYDNIDPIHKFSRVFEVNSILDKASLGSHAGFIFFYMLKRIYAGLDDELEVVDESLRQIESDIFEGKEKEMVYELSNTSRNLIDFKQAIAHHREILNGLQNIASQFFDKDKTNPASTSHPTNATAVTTPNVDFSEYIQSLITEYEKIHDRVRGQSELLEELRSTNNSLLDTQQNETMKIFTVMAFVTLPISLIVEIISIQSPSNFIIALPYLYWIVIIGAFVALCSMLIYFKYKKWL